MCNVLCELTCGWGEGGGGLFDLFHSWQVCTPVIQYSPYCVFVFHFPSSKSISLWECVEDIHRFLCQWQRGTERYWTCPWRGTKALFYSANFSQGIMKSPLILLRSSCCLPAKSSAEMTYCSLHQYKTQTFTWNRQIDVWAPSISAGSSDAFRSTSAP